MTAGSRCSVGSDTKETCSSPIVLDCDELDQLATLVGSPDDAFTVPARMYLLVS